MVKRDREKKATEKVDSATKGEEGTKGGTRGCGRSLRGRLVGYSDGS